MRHPGVCLIAKQPYPDDTRLRQQVKTLVLHGVPVDVICLRQPGEPPRETLHGARVHRLMVSTQSKEGLLAYLMTTLRFGLLSMVKLSALSLRTRYPLIVVHALPESLVFVAVFHRLMGSAVVLDGRDITVELLASRWRIPCRKIAEWLARRAERSVIGVCSAVVTASAGFRRGLIARGSPATSVTVVVNTADQEIFRFDAKRRFEPITHGARILYHGTVSERFGVIYAAMALALVNARIPGSTLDIFGYYDSQYRRSIEDIIEELGLQGSVKLHSPVDLSQIYAQVQKADVGVVPYTSDNFMNLALSTKMFEYVASGLPVVASRLHSAQELFGEDCIAYARAADTVDLADTIMDLCADPERRRANRDRAYKALAPFAEDAVAREYMGVVHQFFPQTTVTGPAHAF